MRSVLLPILVWYTRRVYRKIAREVADQVADYHLSGFTVVGIVGVDGSPSFGVHQTLEVKRSVELVGKRPPTAHAEDINEIVRQCVVEGRGIFLELLRKQLERRGLVVPLIAHDLMAELRGSVVPLRL